MASEVNSCIGDHQLVDLGMFYIRVILQAGAYDLFRLGFQSFRLWSRNDVMWLLSQITNLNMFSNNITNNYEPSD
jgi:hypothetical protein